MTSHDYPAHSEMSQPLDARDALNLFVLHQIRGHSPYMVELENGTFVVHRGDRRAVD